MRTTDGRGIAILICALASACAGETSSDAAPPSISAITCAPHIDRYPVAGPYNGGYDAMWSDFRCDGARNNSDYGGAHHGNDVFALRGTPIVAPVDGVVTRSGTASSTSGLRVTIVDGCGWGYYHGHMDSIALGIVVGAHVRAGDRLGTLGDTGTTDTAPHLHFNVHRDGDYDNDTDPFPLLQTAALTACGVDPHCAGRADGTFCADATHLATCTGGRYSTGDCGAFGTTCDASGGGCTPHLDGVFVGSTFPGGTRIEVAVGAEVHGCLSYRNTGSWTWEHGTTNLGTTEPRDRVSGFPGSDWLSATRMATIASSTATGATGRFCFSLRGASRTGDRVERFSLVEDGHFWAADVGGVSDTTNFLTVVTVAAPPPPRALPDAATTDAGVVADASGAHDASYADDAGPPRRDAHVARGDASGGSLGPRPLAGGCSVSSCGSARASWSLITAVALALVTARRRPRH
jgi:hypothetical protein